MAAVSNVEFSLSPASLNVSANIQVKEGNSTTGFAGQASGPSSTPGLTNQLIQRDQPFNVQFDWTETGGFVPFLAGGTWHIDLLFEAMGGAESGFNPSTTEVSLGISTHAYSTSINVPPFTLAPNLSG